MGGGLDVELADGLFYQIPLVTLIIQLVDGRQGKVEGG